MGLPLIAATKAFSPDQQTTFRAHYWDTTTTAIKLGSAHPVIEQLTAFGSGIKFAMFDLLDSTFKPATPADVEAALVRTTGKTNAVLGYDISNVYRSGVVPNLYEYWGSGAPVGASRSKQVILKYTGFITQAVANATLVFAGQGTVMAVVTRAGVPTTLVNGVLAEPTPAVDTANVTSSMILNDWGYQYNTTPFSFVAGDQLDIYYIQNGESWGGICGKVVASAITPSTFLATLRSAPVIGTSFMSKEAAGLTALTVPYLIDAEIRPVMGAVPEARLRVSLTRSGESSGWVYSKVNDEEFLQDNANIATKLKKGRAIHVIGGFKNLTRGATNLLRWTQVLDNAAWSRTGIQYTPNAVIAPDGTLTAYKVIQQNTLDFHYTFQAVTKAAGAVRYSASMFFKAAEFTSVVFMLTNGNTSGTAQAVFNLSTGKISNQTLIGGFTTPTYRIEDWGDGWYRCIVTATTDSGVAGVTAQFWMGTASGSTTQGNGVNGLYAWGGQVELGEATPYIPATATIVTRPDEEVYPRFTGYIDDIYPDGDDAAIITCRGFEGKLSEPFDTNNPDRLSYMACGYIRREGTGEPVFGIPAYDNWPLETIVRDLCARSSIDAYNIGLTPSSTVIPNFGRTKFLIATTQVEAFGAPLVNAKSLASQIPVVMERQSNYGNVAPMQKDYLPHDDAYLFTPLVTQRVWDRMKGLTDHYGYDFFFNQEGRVVLQGRNNAAAFQYMTQPGAYATFTAGALQRTAVDAVGGIVLDQKHTDAAWTRQFSGKFSRIDLYVGIGKNYTSGLNGGKLSVQIERKDTSGAYQTVSTTEYSTWFDGPESFFYSSVSRLDGTNAAVLRVLAMPYDDYRVTITRAGPDKAEANCHYRLNGVAVFERDPEQTYYTPSGAIQVFSTLKNALKVTGESAYKDLRNHVIVVGQRKATITDSAKLNGETTNPNNPEAEFNVAVAADPFSIYDPTSANFVGGKRMTVIFDDKIGNGDFARYLTRTILYQNRLPKARARTEHTVVPTMELRDAIYVVDERNNTINHMQWVTGYSEKWSVDGTATCSIDGLANPELPSYQPREDVDIDSLYLDTRDNLGEPIINFTLGYKNLYGQAVANADLTNAAGIKGLYSRAPGSSQPMFSEAVATGEVTTKILTKVLIPETLYLSWNRNNQVGDAPVGAVAQLTDGTRKKRALTNMPYRHFWHIASWNATTHVPTLTFQFEEGDGTAGVYDKTYYDFPNLNSGQWYCNFDYLQARTGTNPFYDPYTSELGNLISIKFDLLVKGRLRVSVWDANRPDGRTEIPVAWLTNPTGQADEPEAHWSYSDPAQGTEFLWDATDNIGFFNSLMSSSYAREMSGAFGDKVVGVSRGFYAWNDENTNPFTQIGDLHANNFDANGAPYFTIGKFGQFYIKVEVLNDDLVRKDLVNTGVANPRTVTSDSLPTANAMNTHGAVYAWTHLGEPNQVAIRIQDWVNYPTKKWTRQTAFLSADWSTNYSSPDADATISDGKPVRITFVPLPRRGIMWEGAARAKDASKIGVKLTRNVAMSPTVFDQFWTLYGAPWEHKAEYGARGIEKKRLTNRMYHGEIETLEFEDQTWRTGLNLQTFEWIFDPSLYMKDFGKGFIERLKYGDYTQISTLPNFDSKRLGGTSTGVRDFMMLAFINYLFSFSAHTLDRSGRRQWCLNSYEAAGNRRGFIDRTKIASSNWQTASNDPTAGATYRPWAIVNYEDRGADRYLARTIFTRQWVEPGWKAGTYSGNPVSKYAISNAHQLKFVQPKVTDFEISGTAFDDAAQAATSLDKWMQAYSDPFAEVNKQMYRKGVSTALATLAVPGTYAVRPSAFGTWNFDRPGVEGFFLPSPGRDFHPYWKMPDMPDWSAQYLAQYLTFNLDSGYRTIGLDVLSSIATQINYPLRDPGAQHIWYGYAFADTQTGTFTKGYGARCERTVEEVLGEEKGKNSEKVNANLATSTEGDIKGMFDYVRQDELFRFDNFRGVQGRAPYSDRTIPRDVRWDDSQARRAATQQRVKPSGSFVYNLGRYNRYTLAQTAGWNVYATATSAHYVDQVTDWCRIAFAHETVWYSPRYFPVDHKGTALYGFFKTEYTGALSWIGPSWWYKYNLLLAAPTTNTRFAVPKGGNAETLNLPEFGSFFDPGAWTGWKWDVKAVDWTADPKLRWQEHGGTVLVNGALDGTLGGVSGGSNLANTGGAANAWVGNTTGQARVTEPWLDSKRTSYVRTNIFDDYISYAQGPRLAVGPEIPEARLLVMNLSLTDSLKQ